MNRKCPRCRDFTMKSAGEIKTGPRKGRRRVFRCTKCSYQTIV